MRYTLFIFFIFLIAPVAHAATAPYHYVRTFYYTDSKAHKADFYRHYANIDVFAPQAYALESDGTLNGYLDPALVAFAKAHKIKVMPLVTNDRFSQSSYQTLFADPSKEETAITTLINEAKDFGYVGWQFDFEQMHAEYRQQFSDFIAKAAKEFHNAGLTLSVAVIAKVSDNAGDYKNNLYENLIGVYDYAALATNADSITVMSYDDPQSPGPVVEFPWLQQVLSYALISIPPEKLSLGIPLYYWRWNDFSGKLIGIGGINGINRVFKRHNVSVFYDAGEQAPSLFYTASNGIPYTIWYENARSVAAKIALVKQNNLYGASFWALGLELPSVYQSIKE